MRSEFLIPIVHAPDRALVADDNTQRFHHGGVVEVLDTAN